MFLHLEIYRNLLWSDPQQWQNTLSLRKISFQTEIQDIGKKPENKKPYYLSILLCLNKAYKKNNLVSSVVSSVPDPDLSNPEHLDPQSTIQYYFFWICILPFIPYYYLLYYLLWHSNSVTIFYCDTSTMWHFSTYCDIPTLKIFYCDIPSQSARIVHPPQKVDGLSHCDIPTLCNFG